MIEKESIKQWRVHYNGAMYKIHNYKVQDKVTLWSQEKQIRKQDKDSMAEGLSRGDHSGSCLIVGGAGEEEEVITDTGLLRGSAGPGGLPLSSPSGGLGLLQL